MPLTVTVAVTDAHIALGRRGAGSYASPVALALADALGRAVPVSRGPFIVPFYDERAGPGALATMTAWYTLLGGGGDGRLCDVPLPRRCRLFLDAWEYGPNSGPFAIRDGAGAVIARRTFCEIVVPFEFTLDCP